MKKLLLILLLCFCYLLSHAQCVAGSSTLSSTVPSTNNGQRGEMFDVVAINNITIHCFAPHLYTNATGTYRIYYRLGSHVGHDSNPSDWTFVDSVTNLIGVANTGTLIPIDVNLSILAGDTVAFYITARGPDPSFGGTYYNTAPTGVGVGGSWLSDANLSVLTGIGKAYLFSSSFSPRQYLGSIYYTGGIASYSGMATISSVGNVVDVCPNDSVKLFHVNSNNAYTYQWIKDGTSITGATDSTYFASQAGTYKLRVVNLGGCVDTSAAITITQKTASSITLSQTGGITSGSGITTITQACAGTPITLTATPSGPSITSYQWQRNGVDILGQTNNSLTLTSGWGVYRVRIMNTNNCTTNADTFAISFRSLPNAQAGSDKNICAGSTTTLGTTNNASYTYSWYPSAGLSNVSISNPTITASAGTATYTVYVSQAIANSGGLVCSQSDAVVVNTLTPPLAPTISVSAPASLVGSSTPTLCEGTGTITLAVSNTAGASNLQWLKDGTQVMLTTNLSSAFNINNTNGIAASYTAKVKSSNGCFSPPSNAINATIQSAELPTITPAGTNNIILLCFVGGTSASQVLTASVSNGTPAYTWFQSPNVTNSVGTGSNYTATIDNLATSKSFSVKATYANGCVRTSAWKTVRKNTSCRSADEVEDNFGTITALPNPVGEQLQVKMYQTYSNKGVLTLSNAIGQVVMQQTLELEKGETITNLVTQTLNPGIYYLTLDTQDSHEVIKVVKE